MITTRKFPGGTAGRLSAAAILLAGTSVPAFSQETGATLAARFGALEAFRDLSLSPDGTRIAAVVPYDGGAFLAMIEPAEGVVAPPIKAVMRAPADKGMLSGCNWSTQSRLVCSMRYVVRDVDYLLGFSRNLAIDADGGRPALLTMRDSLRALGVMQFGGEILDLDVGNKPGVVLMSRQFVPEFTTGSRVASDAEGLGVEEVDTITLKRTVVENARFDAADYITDGHGNVRIMATQPVASTGYLRNKLGYMYRPQGERGWQPLSTSTVLTTTGFEPIAVDATTNRVFGFETKDGTIGLYTVALDGTGKKDLVLARPDVDVDRLIRIGRDNRVVGASYATDRRTVEFFDPYLKKLGAALGKALPDAPLVNFVDASAGETRLLLVAASDKDPGMVYLFDKATRKLNQVGPVRPQLEGMKLAEMKPVEFPAADGTSVPAYLTLPVGSQGKNLPAIIMPHGGPSARDEWGFDWLVQFYAARGYAVIQPNYRGSSGYGAEWFNKNGFQSWKTAIGDVNDAGKWLVAQGIAAPSKLAIFGWSYGGYAALQSAVLDADLFKAIVAVAPVTDLEMLRAEKDKFTNGGIVRTQLGTGDHLRSGSPAQNVGVFKAPVLMFHGDMDQNVDVRESRVMADRLRGAKKQVTYVEFPGLDHSLTNAAARTRLLQESDAFLRKSLGIAP